MTADAIGGPGKVFAAADVRSPKWPDADKKQQREQGKATDCASKKSPVEPQMHFENPNERAQFNPHRRCMFLNRQA
ncbi:hypothetical protein [Mesorhizobium sp. ORM8.1]